MCQKKFRGDANLFSPLESNSYGENEYHSYLEQIAGMRIAYIGQVTG